MKKILGILFLFSAFLCLLPSGIGASHNQNTVYWVKIEGEIDLGLAPYIKRVVQEADDQNIAAIILEINTFGGRLDAAVQIRDALLNSSTLTIAYINERAISAGALISLSCQKIYMASGATIGAATPVTSTPFTQEMKPASEKVISYFRKEMKATAETNNRPTLIAEAMVDPDVEIEGLIKKGKLLTLTTTEAVQNKVADLEIKGGREEILAVSQLDQVIVKETKPNWAEKFLRVISQSLMSSLLLTIGLLALFLEFKTPTWGIAGTIGLVCLALFFWGHVVLNLVGWEEIILLSVGVILLLLEAFVIPGFGLAGILGIICLATGLTLSMVGKYPTIGEVGKAASHISIVLLIVLIAFIFTMKSFAKTSLVQRFVLHNQSVPEARLPSYHKEKELEQYNKYLYQKGEALTSLRPAGRGLFGKDRIHVISEGEFITKSSPIKVIRVEGKNIIVRRIDKEKEEI